MEWYWAFAIIVGSMLLFMMVLGLAVPWTLLGIAVISAYVWLGGVAGFSQSVLNAFDAVTQFTLLPIPLFVLMATILFESGLAYKAIDIVEIWLGHLPGRLSLISVVSGAIVGALCGSSSGSCALLGSTLLPDMQKRGYRSEMTFAPIMAAAGLAVLIPPSGLAVLVASIANCSVAGVMMAGFVPGLLLATLFFVYIIIRCKLQPDLAPAYKAKPPPLAARLKITVTNLAPLLIIIFLVTGVIVIGIATPTEAAALGAFGSIIMALAYRSLTWSRFHRAVNSAAKIAILILALMLGTKTYANILGASGCMAGLLDWITVLSVAPIVIVICIQVLLAMLGFVMDEVSIIMILVPIVAPIIQMFDFSMIWFCSLLILNVVTGGITPPFGLTLFVMKGVAPPGTTAGELYRGVSPFVIMNFAMVALVIAYPQIALWFPKIIGIIK